VTLTLDDLEPGQRFGFVYAVATYAVNHLTTAGVIALAHGEQIVFELPSRHLVLKGDKAPRFVVPE
jgi:hypothetical protein